MNRESLVQRLVSLRDDDLTLDQTRYALSDLIDDVGNGVHDPRPITVDDDGAGFLPGEVRAWHVKPKYGASGAEAGVCTFVYFRGLDHPLTFDGDLHEALTRAIGGKA